LWFSEVEGPQEKAPETIDTSKIIDYPGFNVMPPRGVYDVRHFVIREICCRIKLFDFKACVDLILEFCF
jgi:hypothetical protein